MILDTNAVSALSFEDVKLAGILAMSPHHHLPVIVIGECEFGLAGTKRNKELKAWFNLLVSESIVLAVDRETASQYGAVHAALKRGGKPVPSNDVWIAALAIQHSLPIVSREEHFDRIPGVRRHAW